MAKESLSCTEAEAELSSVKELEALFLKAYEESLSSDDRSRAKELRSELESRMTSLREKIFPLERELKLKEQYGSQKQILGGAGIIEALPGGSEGIRDIDGQSHAMPSYREVMALMREKRDILKEKKDQGFTKLLIVPFGMSLDKLSQKYAALLLKHSQESKLFAAKEKDSDPDLPLDLNPAEPLWRWNEYNGADVQGKLVYEPKEFSENHGGKTKAEILAAGQGGPSPSSGQAPRSGSSPAWRILVIEDLPNIPRQGKGKEIGKRKQIEGNRTPNEYLQAVGKGQYNDESGMTPEDWLAYAITHLEEKNQVIDDWQGKGSIAYLTGAYFPATDGVPSADWGRGDRRAGLRRAGPGSRGELFGARSAVRVSSFVI